VEVVDKYISLKFISY